MRRALARCEAIFRLQEPKKRMRDKAARACHALCRARVADELQRRRGTRIGEHLKLVLSIVDRQGNEVAILANLPVRARERTRDHRPWKKSLRPIPEPNTPPAALRPNLRSALS